MQNYIFKCKCPNLVVAVEICYFNNTKGTIHLVRTQKFPKILFFKTIPSTKKTCLKSEK